LAFIHPIAVLAAAPQYRAAANTAMG